MHEASFQRPSSKHVFGVAREDAGRSHGSDNDRLKVESGEGRRSDTDAAIRENAADRRSRTEAVDERDAKIGGKQSSDSGQEHAADTAASVDGSEKGFQPGASTEAPVNALASQQNAQANAQDDTTEAQINKLLEQLTLGESEAGKIQLPAQNEDSSEQLQITARVISQRTTMANWVTVGDQRALFETGLAEHLVRAIFNDTSGSSDNDAGLAGRMPTGPMSSTHNSSGRNQNGSFAQALDIHAGRTSASTENATGNMGRIVNVIRSNVGARHSVLTVQLEPPELGRITLDIRLDNDQVRLSITTETQEARQLLSDRFESLRSSLESQGINVSRFDVQTREFNQGQDAQQQHQQWQGQQNGGQAFNMQQHDTPDQNASQSFADDQQPENVADASTTAAQDTVNLVA